MCGEDGRREGTKEGWWAGRREEENEGRHVGEKLGAWQGS